MTPSRTGPSNQNGEPTGLYTPHLCGYEGNPYGKESVRVPSALITHQEVLHESHYDVVNEGHHAWGEVRRRGGRLIVIDPQSTCFLAFPTCQGCFLPKRWRRASRTHVEIIGHASCPPSFCSCVHTTIFFPRGLQAYPILIVSGRLLQKQVSITSLLVPSSSAMCAKTRLLSEFDPSSWPRERLCLCALAH